MDGLSDSVWVDRAGRERVRLRGPAGCLCWMKQSSNSSVVRERIQQGSVACHSLHLAVGRWYCLSVLQCGCVCVCVRAHINVPDGLDPTHEGAGMTHQRDRSLSRLINGLALPSPDPSDTSAGTLSVYVWSACMYVCVCVSVIPQDEYQRSRAA